MGEDDPGLLSVDAFVAAVNGMRLSGSFGPLVTLEEFFDGNNDYSSIGYNFPPPQPSPRP